MKRYSLLKKVITVMSAAVLAFSCGMTAFAAKANLNTDGSQKGIGVYVKYVDNTVPIDENGKGSATLPDGTEIEISNANKTQGQLVIDPITEKEALDWISSVTDGKVKAPQPFHIYYLDDNGNLINADGISVTMKPETALTNPVVYSLKPGGSMALLSADVKNGTITFTTDGSPYYVLGEKDSGSTPSDPGDSPQTGGNSYTLTFDTNGGSKIDSVSKTSGAVIDLAGYVPTRTGYVFDGWYSDAKLTNKITSVKLTKNMTVYAKWSEKNGENPFTDVADDAYYADAVTWAVGKGITSGTTATTFTPNAPCTRAQAVTFLWRAAGSPAPKSSDMPFTDVAAGSYYHDAVLWAIEQGITKGTSDTTFSPNATCTRAQIVTFLWRSQKSPAAGTANPFTDVAADAYYNTAVLWAAENGVTGGTTATTFSPNANCTRAQIVTFLYRCLGDE